MAAIFGKCPCILGTDLRAHAWFGLKQSLAEGVRNYRGLRDFHSHVSQLRLLLLYCACNRAFCCKSGGTLRHTRVYKLTQVRPQWAVDDGETRRRDAQ